MMKFPVASAIESILKAMFILQQGSGLEELWENCAEDDGTNWQPTTGYW